MNFMQIRSARNCKLLLKGVATHPYCDKRTVAQRLLAEWPKCAKDEVAWKTVRSYLMDVYRSHPDADLRNQCLDMWSNWKRVEMDAISQLAVKAPATCPHGHEMDFETVRVQIKYY